MSDDDWLNWLALDYLQPWSLNRDDYRSAQVVQQLMVIERLLTRSEREIPVWSEIFPAPIDCTKEAQMAKLQRMKEKATEKILWLFKGQAKPKETKET